MEAVLFDPATSTRRALILSLGSYGLEKLTPEASESLIEKLQFDFFAYSTSMYIYPEDSLILHAFPFRGSPHLA